MLDIPEEMLPIPHRFTPEYFEWVRKLYLDFYPEKQRSPGTRRRYRLLLLRLAVFGFRCQVCGRYHDLSFHHAIPKEKNFTIGGTKTKTWTRLCRELKKCVLLCRDCHDDVHNGIIDSPKVEWDEVLAKWLPVLIFKPEDHPGSKKKIYPTPSNGCESPKKEERILC